MPRPILAFAALAMTVCLQIPAHADEQSEDVIASFLHNRELGASGEAVGNRHKTAALGYAGPQPRVNLFGHLGSDDSPHFPSQTLVMSDVVLTAMGYLGRPYAYGSSTMQGGFDCSGFVLSLYQRTLGYTLPRTAAEQARATEAIDRSELKPGDLVFFNTLRRKFSHVGVYIGDGRFIHSPRAGASIRVENMNVRYWRSRFNGARRVITPELAQTVAAASV